MSASKIQSTTDASISFHDRTALSDFRSFGAIVEDGGRWTPVQYYSGVSYESSAEALETAERCVAWLADILGEENPD